MTEKAFIPGAAARPVYQRSHHFVRLDGDALMEQSLFDAVQTLAAQHGQQLSRGRRGYLLASPGAIRHYVDLDDAVDFVRNLVNADIKKLFK